MVSAVTHVGDGHGRGDLVTPGKAWRALRSVLPVATAGAIFVCDLNMPPGIATGVLYVIPVICSPCQPWTRRPLLAGGAAPIPTHLRLALPEPRGSFAAVAIKRGVPN